MISSIGVGFDGQVAKTVNASKWKERLGKGSYALGVIQELHRFQPTRVTLEVDGQVLQEKDVWLIAIANISCYGGGMKICPEGETTTGSWTSVWSGVSPGGNCSACFRWYSPASTSIIPMW